MAANNLKLETRAAHRVVTNCAAASEKFLLGIEHIEDISRFSAILSTNPFESKLIGHPCLDSQANGAH